MSQCKNRLLYLWLYLLAIIKVRCTSKGAAPYTRLIVQHE
jgi:hypothetical protein